MVRLRLFTRAHEYKICLSDTKKINFLEVENDHLDKGIKMGQGSSEQKQKSHSDLKENDIQTVSQQ